MVILELVYLRATLGPHRPCHCKQCATTPAAVADEDHDECEREPEHGTILHRVQTGTITESCRGAPLTVKKNTVKNIKLFFGEFWFT